MLSKNCVDPTLQTKAHHTIWHWLFIDYIRQAIVHLNLCVEIKQERETLAKLSDSELRDIGVHRADADAECRRAFLDVPEDRRGGLFEKR